MKLCILFHNIYIILKITNTIKRKLGSSQKELMILVRIQGFKDSSEGIKNTLERNRFNDKILVKGLCIMV